MASVRAKIIVDQNLKGRKISNAIWHEREKIAMEIWEVLNKLYEVTPLHTTIFVRRKLDLHSSNE